MNRSAASTKIAQSKGVGARKRSVRAENRTLAIRPTTTSVRPISQCALRASSGGLGAVMLAHLLYQGPSPGAKGQVTASTVHGAFHEPP